MIPRAIVGLLLLAGGAAFLSGWCWLVGGAVERARRLYLFSWLPPVTDRADRWMAGIFVGIVVPIFGFVAFALCHALGSAVVGVGK